MGIIQPTTRDATVRQQFPYDGSTPPTNGQVPTYDATAGAYKPAAPSGGGAGGDLATVLAAGNDAGGLGIDNLGRVHVEMAQGDVFHVNAAVDQPDHTFTLFQASEAGIQFTLEPGFYFTAFAIVEQGSVSNPLLRAGYNGGDLVLGKSGGTVSFYGASPVARPEVPASPTVQDVVDKLVALGLITQAA